MPPGSPAPAPRTDAPHPHSTPFPHPIPDSKSPPPPAPARTHPTTRGVITPPHPTRGTPATGARERLPAQRKATQRSEALQQRTGKILGR
ncbi:hypothetical protein B0H15DRAFT_947579 [Mycena belliarum]|uniref:Uncharacterized protein n=1 Tax=Mycena belliarum TaxID=1033014 RepID=A0AAD6U7B3_9AGAR|nr:hypothetical protein B0H15DRAFT_947579 [Mycena belliae]